MDKKFTFTVRSLDRLKPPAASYDEKKSRRTYYRDADCPGLAVCVMESGSKTFYIVKKINGRKYEQSIGRVDEISIKQARQRVRQFIGDLAKGEKPHLERQKTRDEMTLGELFEIYLERPNLATKTIANYRNIWRHDLTKWTNRKLSEVTHGMVSKLHRQKGKTSSYQANRVLSLLSAMYNFANKPPYRAGVENPATGVEKYREKKRTRYLKADEAYRWFDSLEQEPKVWRDYFQLVLYTAARRSDVCAMRWQDIDLDAGVWVIPAPKNQEPTAVRLPPEAVKILKTRRPKTEGFVFPTTGLNPAASGHLMEPSKAWQRIRDRAGLPDVRIHDLRRTHGSWLAQKGASVAQIQKALGQKSPQAAAVYMQFQQDATWEMTDQFSKDFKQAGRKNGKKKKR